MKVLTLTQPWASLMAFDEKRFETRGWKTAHRGPLAIHAAKGWPKKCRDLLATEPFHEVSERIGLNMLPIGQIIAVVELVNIVSIDTMADTAGGTIAACKLPWHGVRGAEHEWFFGDYSEKRYAWITRDVRRLSRPILAKGALSLWEYDTDEINRAIEVQP